MDDIDKTLDDFRRQLGISEKSPRAYIYGDSKDACVAIESLMWPNLDGYEVVYESDPMILRHAFFDKDLIIVGEAVYDHFEKVLVAYSTSQRKQLRLVANRVYQVKPLQP